MREATHYWPYITGTFSLLLSLAASGHAIVYKRDSRAAVGWVGVIWLAPVIGAALYVLFGINRIHRKAESLLDRWEDRKGEFLAYCATTIFYEIRKILIKEAERISLHDGHEIQDIKFSPRALSTKTSIFSIPPST